MSSLPPRPRPSLSVDRPAPAATPAAQRGRLQTVYQRLLERCGIAINGHRPWDMQVHDPRVWRRVALAGTRGLGDAYVEGWWDVERLDLYFERLLKARADTAIWNVPKLALDYAARVANLQNVRRALRVGRTHYDLSEALYRAMLGERMVYTCGYWSTAATLDEAQEAKLELVCRKLELEQGMRVLDVGCGWGSFARYAAERYGVHVTGVTISRKQAEYARADCRGLPIEILEQDYRFVDGMFDRVVSLGMFEHVGRRNYRRYMQVVRDHLKDDGLFVMQTVGLTHHGTGMDPWVNRHIFPNSEVPTMARLSAALTDSFRLDDWHNLGCDYERTLLAWYRNFQDAWPRLKAGFDGHFYRAWSYYLLMFAGAFRARDLDVWQLVLAHPQRVSQFRRPLL